MEAFSYALFKKISALEKLKALCLRNYVILLLIPMFLEEYKNSVGTMEIQRGILVLDIL
jgi:hypothetical protein